MTFKGKKKKETKPNQTKGDTLGVKVSAILLAATAL